MDHKKLALIHIVKRELGLSDDEYRAILLREAGVASAKDLTDDAFRRLMRFLVRSRYYFINRQGMTLRQKLYIDHLRQDLGWDEDHLANYLRKYFRCDRVAALTRTQASNVIVALKHILSLHPPPHPVLGSSAPGPGT
jgi:hypothetical protein